MCDDNQYLKRYNPADLKSLISSKQTYTGTDLMYKITRKVGTVD